MLLGSDGTLFQCASHKGKSRRLFENNIEQGPNEEDMCHAVDKKSDFTLMKKQARSRNISIGIN